MKPNTWDATDVRFLDRGTQLVRPPTRQLTWSPPPVFIRSLAPVCQGGWSSSTSGPSVHKAKRCILHRDGKKCKYV